MKNYNYKKVLDKVKEFKKNNVDLTENNIIEMSVTIKDYLIKNNFEEKNYELLGDIYNILLKEFKITKNREFLLLYL